MPREQTFLVKVYREVIRGLNQAGKDTKTEVRKAFRQSGEVVKQEAAQTMSSINTRTAAGYKVGVTQKGVRVYQSVRKTTGKRPDYGAYQMRRALLPAVRDNRAEIEDGIEHALDVVCDRFNHGKRLA
jgi:hypothetical protein